jgi:hypothetical protein
VARVCFHLQSEPGLPLDQKTHRQSDAWYSFYEQPCFVLILVHFQKIFDGVKCSIEGDEIFKPSTIIVQLSYITQSVIRIHRSIDICSIAQ